MFSLSERIVAKVICDYTAMIQFRSTYELGGQYFCFNTIFQALVSMAVCIVYINQDDADNRDNKDKVSRRVYREVAAYAAN